MPLECRWVESGRKLSTVAAVLYAGRSLVLSSWCRYCGTYNSPTDNTRLNVSELTSGACDAIFNVTW